METQLNYLVRIATSDDHQYATEITNAMALSAAKRGVAIAPRTPEYVKEKMDSGLAVIAVNPDNHEWVGFCCIEVWKHRMYVATSGLIVSPAYRGQGVAKEIKIRLFEQCRTKFPYAKIFSFSASQAVIHVNNELGYKTVAHSELLNDELFMEGGNTWVNFVDLMSNGQTGSHHVAMVFDPLCETGTNSVPSFNFAQYLLEKIKSIRKKKELKVSPERLVA